MPTKRKASISQNADEHTATRRCTRSVAASFSSSSPSRNPLSQGVHASPPSTIKGPVPEPPPEFVAFSTPTRKYGDKRLTRSQIKASAAIHSRPPSVVTPRDREDDQSEDELLFLPNRKATKKKGSGKASSKVSQLPRVFVEIVSPAPRTPKHLTVKAVASPASPTPTRSKVIQKLSPSSPLSPTSTKVATAKRIRPSRPLVQSALYAGDSGPSHSSSRYPHSCLHAQKRSILHALHYPRTAVFDREDENGEPSANAIALEQLSALLTGTLERGEGNSCLLIGPRGSGKSRVSILTPDVSTVLIPPSF